MQCVVYLSPHPRLSDLSRSPPGIFLISMLALRPLRTSSRGLKTSALRSADSSGESSSSYLRRQAALEDALPQIPREPAPVKEDQSVFEKATRKSTPKLVDSTTVPWDGEETQRKLVERVLQDSYKPLRVRLLNEGANGC